MKIEITTEYITLDSAMKLAGIVGTGGQAKLLIADGFVKVNGKQNSVFRKKLYEGDSFEIDGSVYEIVHRS
jgi:ribosome-associated protein